MDHKRVAHGRHHLHARVEFDGIPGHEQAVAVGLVGVHQRVGVVVDGVGALQGSEDPVQDQLALFKQGPARVVRSHVDLFHVDGRERADPTLTVDVPSSLQRRHHVVDVQPGRREPVLWSTEGQDGGEAPLRRLLLLADAGGVRLGQLEGNGGGEADGLEVGPALAFGVLVGEAVAVVAAGAVPAVAGRPGRGLGRLPCRDQVGFEGELGVCYGRDLVKDGPVAKDKGGEVSVYRLFCRVSDGVAAGSKDEDDGDDDDGGPPQQQQALTCTPRLRCLSSLGPAFSSASTTRAAAMPDCA